MRQPGGRERPDLPLSLQAFTADAPSPETVSQIGVWSDRPGDKLMSTVLEPIRLQVEMEVTRTREFPRDNLVQVWGLVGDYEVSVWMSRDDERVERLCLPRRRSRPT